MIPLVCLGILLAGIVMIPGGFAADGCGQGTVLVDGVCELAPVEYSEGCGEGTVMVNGVCELAESSGTSIPPLYIAGGAAAIGAAIIGIIFAVRRGSSETKTPKPAKKELEEYEEKYLANEKPAKQKPAKQKPAEKKETSAFCENCGASLNPKAKFCGSCGTAR